jgi:hypothetical protein
MAWDDPPETGLVRHQPAALTRSAAAQPARPGGALAPAAAPPAPAAPVRQAVPAMLEASADTFGATVSALLCDLGRISQSVENLSWLSVTPSLLQGELSYQAAWEQQQWWERFLARLPNPELLSDQTRQERERAQAERYRVALLAREAALEEHRRLVAIEMEKPGTSRGDRWRLQKIYDDPDERGWWLDPEAVVQAALDRLPQPPKSVPIAAQDLDLRFNPAGFNAVQTMREHPELGPRARAMDAALAAVLRREFKLPKRDAQAHAQAMTGIFWFALRRALGAGDRQLATALHLMVSAEEAPIGEQFSRELLESWLHYLENLPLPRPSLGQRIGRLLGRGPAEPAALPAPAPARQALEAPPPRRLLGQDPDAE